MWDSVPWLVEGGAQHSANIARKFAYAAVGGQDGIIGSGDLEVRETAVPGTNIRVYPGLATLLNRASGISKEMYLASLISEDVKGIAATTAGGPRSDMIIARVENPWLAGEPWPDPADPTVGPYVKTIVVPGVSNTATTVPAGNGNAVIPLARIDLPPSTGTIIQSYITDLRYMAPVLRSSKRFMLQVGAGDTLGETVLTLWPFALTLPVRIPIWATNASINAVIAGVALPPGDARGDIRCSLGTTQKTATNVIDLNNGSAFNNNVDIHCGGNVAVPAAMRGTTVNVFAEARSYITGVTTHLVAGEFTTCTLEIEFSAEPSTNV